MRLALQALFGAQDNQTEEGRQRSERIEREIRNNERSGSFLRKLRKVVSDPRLKAPEVFADEAFPDPNVVAEYLDCQSESEEIRNEYEDVCAESPEILAEAGCCYDVLNNRLGRPIEAPKNCRRRLYYIAWEEGDGPSKKTENEKTSVKSERSATAGRNARANTPKAKSRPAEVRESEVQKKMRSERSLGRRLSRWIVNGTIAAGLLSAGYWGVTSWRSNSGSETFEVANATSDSSETVENENAADETTASRDQIAGVESLNNDQSESVQDNAPSFDFITEEANDDNSGVDVYADSNVSDSRFESSADSETNSRPPVYVAQNPIEEEPRNSAELRRNEIGLKPLAESDDSNSAKLGYLDSRRSEPSDPRTGGLNSLNGPLNDADSTQARGGLRSTAAGELRSGIVIPDKNNDVFSTSTRR